MLYDTVDHIKQEVAFAGHCQKTYSAVSLLFPKPLFVSSIVHDLLMRVDRSIYKLQGPDRYASQIKQSRKVKDECLTIEKLTVSISRPENLKGNPGALEETLSQNCSSSTEGDDLPAKDKNADKGFKPKQMYKWNTGDDTFDLKVSDAAFDKVLGKRTLASLTVKEACALKDKLEGVCKTAALSDEVRRDLWRAKIGNGLRINKAMYSSLVDKLAAEPISRKAEKTIVDDLDRTFPICSDVNEGKQMYQNMKLVLSLFEVARD